MASYPQTKSSKCRDRKEAHHPPKSHKDANSRLHPHLEQVDDGDDASTSVNAGSRRKKGNSESSNFKNDSLPHQKRATTDSLHVDKTSNFPTLVGEQGGFLEKNGKMGLGKVSKKASSKQRAKRSEKDLSVSTSPDDSKEAGAQQLSSSCEKTKKRSKKKHTKGNMENKEKGTPSPGVQSRVENRARNRDGKVPEASKDSQQHEKKDKSGKDGRGSGKQLFEAYMTLEDVSAGLKRGELVQGVLRINPKRYKEAYVPSPDGSADLFLDGISARNRALNGDVVVVKPLPFSASLEVNGDVNEKTTRRLNVPATPDVMVEAQYDGDDEVVGRMKNVSLNEKAPSDGSANACSTERTMQRTAKVVFIVEGKHSRAASGFIKFLPNKNFAMFSPVDHRVPRVNVPLADCPTDFSLRPGDYENTLFICRITHWPQDNSFAQGRLVKSLGQAGQIEPETEGILMEYGVDFSEFQEDVLRCLPQNLPWSIPPHELSKRRDLRNECIFTIDPATARDLDDALSCKQLPDGNFEVGVHIADVSFFLEEGNALDHLAGQRATSVYLVQKVIPMLPRLLCEELCSLNPLTDRLTFSVIWTLSPEGKILSEWFGRTVICSCIKLSYDHAQSMIEAPEKRFSAEELPVCAPSHSIQEIQEAVLNLHRIATQLRGQRFQDGALRLDQLKLSFTLDKESGMPQGCYVYQYRDSNKLVEEFMLLANMAVGHQIYRTFPELALLRRHPPPQTKMVDDLQEFFDQMGLDIDFSSSKALHRSLNENLGRDEYTGARKEVVTHMCSRPMQMAVYFCAGALNDEKSFHHYALNVPLYTHFTSPIRRYADVIVHRLLAASLGCGRRLRLSGEEVHAQASHCNDRKTASKRVQELSSDLFFGVFVKECGPLESEAMVMGVLDQSFDVLVLQFGVQKRIYCNSLEGLKEVRYRKLGKKPEMTLVWETDDPSKEPVQQEISIFTLVAVQLQADGAPMKYRAVLKKPTALA